MLKLLAIFILLYFSPTSAQNYTFAPAFKFGLATAAYQVEGAWNENGKGENVWDRICHTHPNFVEDQQNGDVACDTYHHTAEDVALLKGSSVNFYRFSLSWSRILPTGFSNQINPDGIRYYNELINALVANGITPLVTLYHWDLPQPLQEIGGFPNPALIDIFTDYARVAFEQFGDRVKYWLTFNEPYQICQQAYSQGFLAPAYRSEGIGCYLCSYTLLLAHAKAYKLYDQQFRPTQQGKISITIDTSWSEPKTQNVSDIAAAERNLQMSFGWFVNPIFSTNGDYPAIMKQRIAALSKEEGFLTTRLYPFTQAEVDYIKGTFDFFGVNTYTTNYITNGDPGFPSPSHDRDVGVIFSSDPTWEAGATDWLKVVPWGIRKLMNWIKDTYNNPEIIITENGFSDFDGLHDCRRINYYNSYLENVWLATYVDGCRISGYTAWSFLDNFEWTKGYNARFGVTHINFNDPARTRVPKQSYFVYKNIIQNRKIDWNYTPPGFQVCDFGTPKS